VAEISLDFVLAHIPGMFFIGKRIYFSIQLE
jgi:hypothetical protein